MRKLFNNQSGRVSKGILSLILAVSMLLAVLTPVRALADDAAPSEVQIQEEAVGSPAPEEAETAASAEESPIQVEMQVQEAPAAEAAQAEALPSDAAAEPAAVEAASVEPSADEAEKSSAAPAASDQAETEIGNTIPNIETEIAETDSAETESIETEEIKLADTKVTAAIYTDGTYRTIDSDDAAKIEVSGLLPEGAVVKAYPVTVILDQKATAAAYDITIFDAEGAIFQPAEDQPLEVSIKVPDLDTMIENSNASDLKVYHLEDEADSPREVPITEKKGEEVTFEAESFSIYVVTYKPGTGSEPSTEDEKLSIETTYIAVEPLEAGQIVNIKANDDEMDNETFTWTAADPDIVTLGEWQNGTDGGDSSSFFTALKKGVTQITLTSHEEKTLKGRWNNTSTSRYSPDDYGYTNVRDNIYTDNKGNYYLVEENYSRRHGYYYSYRSFEETSQGSEFITMDQTNSVTLDVHVLEKGQDTINLPTGSVTANKTLEPTQESTKKTADGYPIYDLALTFSGTSQTIQQHEDVDVFFIVDTSSSMVQTNRRGQVTDDRITAAKNAIAAFEGVAEDKELNARYSLITFGGSENTYYYSDSPYNDASIDSAYFIPASGSSFAGSLTFQAGDHGGSNGSGTNYQAGILAANNLINNDHTSARKMVIFLTDGVPTFYYNASGITAGSGSSYDAAAMANARTAIKGLNLGSSDYFYAIGCGTADETNLEKLKTAADATGCKAGYIYKADSAALSDAFREIAAGTLTQDTANVEITDTLSKETDFAGLKLTDGAEIVVEKKLFSAEDTAENWEDDSADWTITKDGDAFSAKLKSGKMIDARYIYRLRTTVTASDTAKKAFGDGTVNPDTGDAGTGSFAGKNGYHSNTHAAVTYDTVKSDGTVEKEDPIAYANPVFPLYGITIKKQIHLDSTSLDEAEKADAVKALAEAISYRITDESGNAVETVTSSDLVKNADGSLAEDTDGYYYWNSRFLDPDMTYYVEELLPDEDAEVYETYQIAFEKAEVTVGKTTSDGSRSSALAVSDENPRYEVLFDNTYKDATKEITISKVWEDEDDAYGVRPDEISVTLTAQGREDIPVTLTADGDDKDDPSDDWTKKIEVPAGTVYTITEDGIPSGYKVSYRYSSGEKGLFGKEIWKDAPDEDTVQYQITNAISLGSLQITKTILDNTNTKGGSFAFTATNQETGMQYTMTVHVNDGASASGTITGIPAGTYKVVELGSSQYESVDGTAREVTVEEGQTAAASFTNKGNGDGYTDNSHIVNGGSFTDRVFSFIRGLYSENEAA